MTQKEIVRHAEYRERKNEQVRQCIEREKANAALRWRQTNSRDNLAYDDAERHLAALSVMLTIGTYYVIYFLSNHIAFVIQFEYL